VLLAVDGENTIAKIINDSRMIYTLFMIGEYVTIDA